MELLRADSAGIARAARALAEGFLVAIPTETVYGLACRWGDHDAIARIYAAKSRDARKPLQMLALDIEAAEAAGLSHSETVRAIARRFCPGPLTIVAPSSDGFTIGVRIPAHPFVRALMLRIGSPLAATSANLSGHHAALCANDAITELAIQPDILIDGGALPSESMASTVVEITPSGLRLLRQGSISLETINAAIMDAKD